MGEEKREIIIYPWNLSATGQFAPDTGLDRLRDEDPKYLARILWGCGERIVCCGIIEIMAHGNQRRAAEVAREFVTQHPDQESYIRRIFQEGGDDLLVTPLEKIPSKPSEYPESVRVVYGN